MALWCWQHAGCDPRCCTRLGGTMPAERLGQQWLGHAPPGLTHRANAEQSRCSASELTLLHCDVVIAGAWPTLSVHRRHWRTRLRNEWAIDGGADAAGTHQDV